MTDLYQHWVERVSGGRNAKPLSPGDIVKSSEGEPFGTVEFVQIPKPFFMAEVGKKGNAYIYHFYPVASIEVATGKKFYDCLSAAFLEVFKRKEQIEADWVDEMQAWAVRVHGWTDNVWGDELALRAINRVDEVLREKSCER